MSLLPPLWVPGVDILTSLESDKAGPLAHTSKLTPNSSGIREGHSSRESGLHRGFETEMALSRWRASLNLPCRRNQGASLVWRLHFITETQQLVLGSMYWLLSHGFYKESTFLCSSDIYTREGWILKKLRWWVISMNIRQAVHRPFHAEESLTPAKH